MTNVLIIGSGGREHALTWAIAKSPQVKQLFCAPGNGGMASLAKLVDLNLKNHADVLQFIKDNQIGLTVIGPEAPLVDGLADSLRKEKCLVVGAGKKGAELEGSKIAAKLFMDRYGIPTARFKTFDNFDEAQQFVSSPEAKNFLILKADGLAAGKGVYVNKNTQELKAALTEVMKEKKFGDAGSKILLEETLTGPEISIIALTDGKTILPFPASQDHKRAFDDDKGPNTGGMGAYAPTPFFDAPTRMRINKEVVDNFLRGLQSEGIDFRGFIYFGLMLTPDGPKVLEFNVRFGDPEAQAVLPLIESDLFQTLNAVSKGELSGERLQIRDAAACTIVMASGGYPGSYEKGRDIVGINDVDKKENIIVFHAGTKQVDGQYLTSGGRVLAVTGIGKDLDAAVVHAYQAVKRIGFKECFFRHDIAYKALKNKNILNRIKRMKNRHGKEVAYI